MEKHYALQIKGTMQFTCVADNLRVHEEKAAKYIAHIKDMYRDLTGKDIMKNYIPVIITIEHQTEPKPNEAVTK